MKFCDWESVKSRMAFCDVRDGRSKLFCLKYLNLSQMICIWLQLQNICIGVSSSRLQKEHSESCKISNLFSILYRNNILLSNLYWKTQIVVSTVAIWGRRYIVFQSKLEFLFKNLFEVWLRCRFFIFDYNLYPGAGKHFNIEGATLWI